MKANSSSLVCSPLNVQAQQHFTEEVAPRLDQDSSNLTESENSTRRQEELEDEDNNIQDDFTFAIQETKPSIAAEDIFHNGQIRPLFPVFGQDNISSTERYVNFGRDYLPVKKVFVERSDLPSSWDADKVAEGPYGGWSKDEEVTERCKKSNSTGFSKLWRFRELLSRSNSDGKDTFLFLNENGKNNKDERNGTTSSSSSSEERSSFGEKKGSSNEKKSASDEKRSSGGSGRGIGGRGKGKVKALTNETASVIGTTSSYALQYGKLNRGGKEGERIKSYLPYRQDLVGFFTNASAMSRNVHPY